MAASESKKEDFVPEMQVKRLLDLLVQHPKAQGRDRNVPTV